MKVLKLVDQYCKACQGTGLNLGGGSQLGSIEVQILNCDCVEFVTIPQIVDDVIHHPMDPVDDDTPKGTVIDQDALVQLGGCNGTGWVDYLEPPGGQMPCRGCVECKSENRGPL